MMAGDCGRKRALGKEVRGERGEGRGTGIWYLVRRGTRTIVGGWIVGRERELAGREGETGIGVGYTV